MSWPHGAAIRSPGRSAGSWVTGRGGPSRRCPAWRGRSPSPATARSASGGAGLGGGATAPVPGRAWQIAVDGDGEVRERRADAACADTGCGHRRCWTEEAHVTELTAILRDGRSDELAGWPEAMRVFARRERPHPGAQLTLFEAADGWRYTLWATNLPAATRGWRGQAAYIDAAHRVHARVESGIRTGKQTGIGKLPSHSQAINGAWLAASLIAATLIAWLQLTALDGDLARAEPRTLRPVNRTWRAFPQVTAPVEGDGRQAAHSRQPICQLAGAKPLSCHERKTDMRPDITGLRSPRCCLWPAPASGL